MSIKKKVNPCKKCGTADVDIHNCGYSSFNVGTVKCKNCKETITIDHISSDESGDVELLKRWNYLNSEKFILTAIKSHETSIESLKKQLSNVK